MKYILMTAKKPDDSEYDKLSVWEIDVRMAKEIIEKHQSSAELQQGAYLFDRDSETELFALVASRFYTHGSECKVLHLSSY